MQAIIRQNQYKFLALGAAALFAAACFLLSIMSGITWYGWNVIIAAYSGFDGSNEHLILRNVRVPRACIAAAVGASLAVAGAVMQAVTRNPLASPAILGVNAGAAFFIVIAVTFLQMTSLTQYAMMAFIGAALTAVAVYVLGSAGRDGLTPLKMTLAGAALAAFLSSLTQGALLVNGRTFNQVLYWLVGSVAGRDMDVLMSVLPFMTVGAVLSLWIGRPLNVLVMGDEVAKGLGQRTIWIKLGGGLIVVLLAGGAVAVAGPIGFIGIVVPHIVRTFTGEDYRWLIPFCALIGAILLLLADIGARLIVMPNEVPVGVVTAVIGVPFFVYAARRRLT